MNSEVTVAKGDGFTEETQQTSWPIINFSIASRIQNRRCLVIDCDVPAYGYITTNAKT